MKKILPVFAALLLASGVFAAAAAPKADPVKAGDACFNLRNSITDTAADLINMDKAIAYYKEAFDADKTDGKLLLKYAKALDFKYRYLTGTAEEKKAKYEDLSREFEQYGASMGKTKEYNFVMALMYARRGDLTPNVLEAAKEGVADKIKNYAEAVYNIDRAFEDYASCLILGRLHYKSPNIVFVLTWPDKNKSKDYLEEIYRALPGDTEAKYFLADTYWELGKRDEATKLYKEAAASKPRADHWYYDNLAIEHVKARMEELGIK